MAHGDLALSVRSAGGTLPVVCVLVGLLGAPPASSSLTAASPPRIVWQVSEPARGIPARDAQSAYFLTHRHELVAASTTSGRVRWRVPMDGSGTTFGSRVIVRGDVVVAGDYDLAGVHRRTGRRLWTFVATDGGGAGLHLGDATGDVAFSGSLTGMLRAIDISAGRQRWALRVGDPTFTTVYSPVVSQGVVAAAFTIFGDEPAGGLVLADVRTGRTLWHRKVPGSIGASGNPVFVGDDVAVASRDGRIHGFDVRSGAVRWTLPKVDSLGDEQDYRPLAAVGRTLIAGSLSGEVVAYDLPSQRVRWRRAPTMASVAFSLTAADGVVYVPYLSNQIVAFRVRDGTELWRLGGGTSQFRWAPLVAGPLLLAAGSHVFSVFRHDVSAPNGR